MTKRTLASKTACYTSKYRPNSTRNKKRYNKRNYPPYKNWRPKNRKVSQYMDVETQVVENVDFVTAFTGSSTQHLIDGAKWPIFTTYTGGAQSILWLKQYQPYYYPLPSLSTSPSSTYATIDQQKLNKYEYIQLFKTELTVEFLPSIDPGTSSGTGTTQSQQIVNFKGFLLSDCTTRYRPITMSTDNAYKFDIPEHPGKYRYDSDRFSRGKKYFVYDYSKKGEHYSRWYRTTDLASVNVVMAKLQTHLYKFHNLPMSTFADNYSTKFRVHIKRHFRFAKRKDELNSDAFGITNIAIKDAIPDLADFTSINVDQSIAESAFKNALYASVGSYARRIGSRALRTLYEPFRNVRFNHNTYAIKPKK